ncbi:MAG TPA: MBL fold metallo-hydrolase [Polyangia bacterium]|jgi:metallo-beta-lactamase family protein
MRLSFLGAARTVTGSMHLLETDHGSLLVDCGMFQGRREEANDRNRSVPEAALGATAMVLTHAHIDHSGNIPSLVRDGFRGTIFATPATVDLAHALLFDSARIQQNDADFLNRKYARDPDFEPAVPLYTESDAHRALARFAAIEYGREFIPMPGVRCRFVEAGHILGSAQVMVEVDRGSAPARVLFSGDLGRKGLPILKDPELPPARPDHLVIESTYGNRFHKDVATSHEELAAVINATVERKGKVIVPAFAVGRTQELVYALNQLEAEQRIPPLPVYVDSPLSTEVTRIFEQHAECFDTETAAFLKQSGNPFGFRNLKYVSSREDSMRLNTLPGPFIVVASSGMCEAGRVLHHLRNSVESERNTVVIVGFQAEHTLGRRLVERRPKVRILGMEHEVHCRVATINAFSAHADQRELCAHAVAVNPAGRCFVVHGEPEAAEGLQKALGALGLSATVPSRGDTIELD